MTCITCIYFLVNCSEGWSKLSNKCFKPICDLQNGMDFNRAKNTCIENDSKMSLPKDTETNEFVS